MEREPAAWASSRAPPFDRRAFHWNPAPFADPVASRTRRRRASVVALDPQSDVRGNLFGRDLFVPGFIASMHLPPFDFLDVVVGFKWSDRVKSNVKLDITTGAFGTGETFEFNDASAGQVATVGSSIPTTTNNQPGEVDSAADLGTAALACRPLRRSAEAALDGHARGEGSRGGVVEDPMVTERWDMELDFSTTSRRSTTAAVHDARRAADAAIDRPETAWSPRSRRRPAIASSATDHEQLHRRSVGQDRLGGKDQFTVRAGGDYNIMPASWPCAAACRTRRAARTRRCSTC